MKAMSFNDLRSVNNISTFYRDSTDRDTESWGFFSKLQLNGQQFFKYND